MGNQEVVVLPAEVADELKTATNRVENNIGEIMSIIE